MQISAFFLLENALVTITPDDIRKYNSRLRESEQCRKNCNALWDILMRLKIKYARYKYVPSVIRYFLVKNMIKSTVDKYQHIQECEPEDDDQNEPLNDRPVGVADFLHTAEELAKHFEPFRGKWVSQTVSLLQMKSDFGFEHFANVLKDF